MATLAAAALAFTGVPLAQAATTQTAPGNAPAVVSAKKDQTPKRQVENLDRAPVAVLTDQGVSVSWRMLGLDKDSIGFQVLRDGVNITPEPIRNSTFFVDPAGTATSSYVIKTVGNGQGQDKLTEAVTPLAQNYLAIKLDKPADGVAPDGKAYTYSANDATVADLDGDGKYEVIQTWSPSNAKDNSQSGYTGNVYVDAYKLDGTKLWRIDLGRNIRAGAHYTQVLAYDFDGDGKAEVSLKTADGTTDASGTVIGDANADYRNSAGYVLAGPEFLTVFKGGTGTILDTVAYEPERGLVASWGDNYGNRVDRFLAAVAYLDGEHPSRMFSRGYYTRTVLVTYDLVDGKLV